MLVTRASQRYSSGISKKGWVMEKRTRVRIKLCSKAVTREPFLVTWPFLQKPGLAVHEAGRT